MLVEHVDALLLGVVVQPRLWHEPADIQIIAPRAHAQPIRPCFPVFDLVAVLLVTVLFISVVFCVGAVVRYGGDLALLRCRLYLEEVFLSEEAAEREQRFVDGAELVDGEQLVTDAPAATPSAKWTS